jgi:2-iminobutanoate/2-iminopropanoate deaminase
MKRKIISTEHAPAAVGPYSQAVRVGKLLYTAGQIPLDPATGKLVEGDIAVQAERALDNLQAVLEAAGTSLKNVVKTTVFLQNMDDFGAMNEVYARYFVKKPPARSAVEVAALPLGAQIEIEAVALVK